MKLELVWFQRELSRGKGFFEEAKLQRRRRKKKLKEC